MGGGGGGLGLLTPYFGQNIGNRNIENNTGRIIANIFDPTGMSSFTTLNAAEQTGATSGGQTASQVIGTEPKTIAPSPAPVEVPVDENAAATSRAAARRKKKQQASSQTIYTSSLGVTDQADISRKTLLGM